MHYLDNAATTRPYSQVVDFTSQILMEYFGNPSSVHPLGIEANRLINESRKTLSDIFDVPMAGILFCSGGTESNNLALKGVFNSKTSKNATLITSKIEHASVSNTAQWLKQAGCQIKYTCLDNSTGRVDLQQLENIIDVNTRLVSIQHVNSETGVIQDLNEISKVVKSKNKNTIIHSDGVQAFGKIPIQFSQLGADLYSISAHKFHGLKGAGALICARNIPLEAILHGGGQEYGLRSGTENVASIASMGLAARLSIQNENEARRKIIQFSDWFKKSLKKELPNIRIFETPFSVPHIISASLPGIPGEALMNHLAAEGIYVGLGSACSSKTNKLSSVLKALDYSHQQIKETIRISLAALEIPADPESFLNQFIQTVRALN